MKRQLYAWQFNLLQTVYHNGKFSHNIPRTVIIRCYRRHKAPDFFQYSSLIKEQEYDLGELHIQSFEEIIHSVQFLGKARLVSHWEYDK